MAADLAEWLQACANVQDIRQLPTLESADESPEIQSALQRLATRLPEQEGAVFELACRWSPQNIWENAAVTWLVADGSQNTTVSDNILAGVLNGVYDAQAVIVGVTTSPYLTPRALALCDAWAHRSNETFFASCSASMKRAASRLSTHKLLLDVLIGTAEEIDSPHLVHSDLIVAFASSPSIKLVLSSLLYDTGNQLFTVTLRLFLSILPYAPHVLTKHVPLIMIVVGRAACWRDRPFLDGQSHSNGRTTTPKPNPAIDWEIATTQSEVPITLPSTLHPERIVRLLLVAVYNAWPSNVLAFVRDPAAYITGKGIEPVYELPWAEVWDAGSLAARLGPLLRNFHLHPSLVYFTSTSELADQKRWDKIDPAEFIARSHMLAHSELMSGGRVDLLEEEPESLAASNTEGSQSENELLRIEAKFTERVRKQYLHHIGRLHKQTLKFNSDEAEINSFVNRLKEQGKTIETLTADLAQQRADASQAQQKHVKWQEQLREKLAANREERKTWQNEASRIRGELQEAKLALQRQQDEITVVKNERSQLQNQVTEMLPKVRHIQDYETRMKQLTDCQRLWDNDVRRYHEAVADVEVWRGQCHQLETMVRACEKQKEHLTARISLLEKQIHQPVSSPRSPEPAVKSPDLSFYVQIAENAKKRAEVLGRENLELRAELERMKRQNEEKQAPTSEDRTFIWGDTCIT